MSLANLAPPHQLLTEPNVGSLVWRCCVQARAEIKSLSPHNQNVIEPSRTSATTFSRIRGIISSSQEHWLWGRGINQRQSGGLNSMKRLLLGISLVVAGAAVISAQTTNTRAGAAADSQTSVEKKAGKSICSPGRIWLPNSRILSMHATRKWVTASC